MDKEVQQPQKTVGPNGKSAPVVNGVVVPHTLTGPQRVLAFLIYWLIRLVSGSLRSRWEYHPAILNINEPVIFAVWHNRLPLSLPMYRGYLRATNRSPKMAAIVSASKDGAIVARVLELFRVQPVRGSSSRRGPQALLELTSWADQGYDLAITPDGPRGPRYVIQPGAIALGQLTGLPIIPVANFIRWKICAKSWDGFQIPLPFSAAVMKMGEPLRVPRDLTDDERERLRRQLEARLTQLTVD